MLPELLRTVQERNASGNASLKKRDVDFFLHIALYFKSGGSAPESVQTNKRGASTKSKLGLFKGSENICFVKYPYST